MAGISADATGGQTTLPTAIVTTATAKIDRACEDRRRVLIASTLPQSARARKVGSGAGASSPRYRRGLILHDYGGADGDTIIQIGHVFIGHAEAAGRYRLADRFRLV